MREVEVSPRHRMTAGVSPKGEGPVYQLPCPHSPFNKPGLLSVCLSYIYIHIYLCVYTHLEHLGKYNTKFNTRNIDYTG